MCGSKLQPKAGGPQISLPGVQGRGPEESCLRRFPVCKRHYPWWWKLEGAECGWEPRGLGSHTEEASRGPCPQISTVHALSLPSSVLFSLFHLPQSWHRLSVGTWSPFSSRLHLSEAPLLCEPCLSLPSESFYGPPPMFSVHQPYILFSAPSHPP